MTKLFKATYHDDVNKWKLFPRYWPFVRGIHRSPVNSPHQGQWRWALTFYLICAWASRWVNNRETGDLRRHHAHYDVSVMHNERILALSSVAAQGSFAMTTSHNANDNKFSITTLHFRCSDLASERIMIAITMTSHERQGVSNRRQLDCLLKTCSFDNKENINAPYYWPLDSPRKGPVMWTAFPRRHHVDGLVQNCRNSIANALELLQSCTKPSMWMFTHRQCWKDQDVLTLHL